MLIAKAETRARSWGCRSVALHCDVNNWAAVRLYKGLGFKCIRVPENAKWPEPMTSPSLQFHFMMKLITPKASPWWKFGMESIHAQSRKWCISCLYRMVENQSVPKVPFTALECKFSGEFEAVNVPLNYCSHNWLKCIMMIQFLDLNL